MALYPQTGPRVLVGDTLADRPAPGNVPGGTIFHAISTLEGFVVVQNPATLVRRWEPLAQPAPGSVGWPPYVVSQTDPAATYQTISAAIAAAVANGHGANNPTTVMVFPASYTENVTLRAGIGVIGAQQNIISAKPLGLNGRVEIADEPGIYLLSGFAVNGPPGVPAIHMDGTGGGRFVELRLLNVEPSIGQSAVMSDSTGKDTLLLFNCGLAGTPGAFAVDLSATTETQWEDVGIGVSDDSVDKAARLRGTARLAGCQIDGQIQFLGDQGTVLSGFLQATSQPVALVGPGTLLRVLGGQIAHTDASGVGTDTTIANATVGGSLQIQDVQYTGSGRRIDPTLAQVQVGDGTGGVTLHYSNTVGQFPDQLPIVASTITQNQPSELTIVDTKTEVAPVTLNLPPVGTCPATKLLRFVQSGGAQNVVLTPAVGDSMNGGATLSFTLGTNKGVILSADSVAKTWWVTAQF